MSTVEDMQQIWVVKVGSSLVTADGCGIDYQRLSLWAEQISILRKQGKQIILISSGAVAEGIKRLGWQERPKAVNELQAAAAVGQMGLAQAYEEVFLKYDIRTAQILLTHEDLKHRTRYLNARSTIRTLLSLKVLPVINENDTVATSEIKLGDNDTLSALVTNLVEADMLLILTDQEGLYEADPRHNPTAKLISKISVEHPHLEQMAGGAGSVIGTGGMYTKVLAAKRAAISGASTLIASGKKEDVLLRISQGESIGTIFYSTYGRLSARQQWIMGQLRLSGSLLVDDGAAKAIECKHSSLLSIGCIGVNGSFRRGEVVAIIDGNNQEIARGLVNYHSDEVKKICRKPSQQIEAILGYIAEDELVHRDNMVLSLHKN